ncbi:MAG: NUDIX hydrolase [Catenulispora sp.]|nr:NUDIX hydrolase [Catenulispora sp.]
MDRAAWAAALPKSVASGSLLCADAAGRTLLVRQSYRGTDTTVWGVPGGGLEEGESPAQGARRETLEEIGLDIVPGRLLMLDWRSRDGARPPLAQYLFDGGTLSDEDIARIRLQEKEIAEYGFFDLDAARERLAPHTFERLTRALAVRDGREALQDLEEGVPRPGGAA